VIHWNIYPEEDGTVLFDSGSLSVVAYPVGGESSAVVTASVQSAKSQPKKRRVLRLKNEKSALGGLPGKFEEFPQVRRGRKRN